MNLDYSYKNISSKTIVLLHGWGLNKKCFDNIVNKINDDYSILVVDLPGFGNSREPKSYFDAYEYAYQIFLLLKKLSINNIVLVGHSFGGRISIILSSLFDISICKLILTSSAGLNKFSIIKSIKIIKYKMYKLLCKIGFFKYKNNKFGSNDYIKLNNNMKKIFVNVVNQDLQFLLRYINCKTILVWDKCDKVTRYWICKKLHRQIANSYIITWTSGGHFVAFKNSNKFAKLLVYDKNI